MRPLEQMAEADLVVLLCPFGGTCLGEWLDNTTADGQVRGSV